MTNEKFRGYSWGILSASTVLGIAYFVNTVSHGINVSAMDERWWISLFGIVVVLMMDYFAYREYAKGQISKNAEYFILLALVPLTGLKILSTIWAVFMQSSHISVIAFNVVLACALSYLFPILGKACLQYYRSKIAVVL